MHMELRIIGSPWEGSLACPPTSPALLLSLSCPQLCGHPIYTTLQAPLPFHRVLHSWVFSFPSNSGFSREVNERLHRTKPSHIIVILCGEQEYKYRDKGLQGLVSITLKQPMMKMKLLLGMHSTGYTLCKSDVMVYFLSVNMDNALEVTSLCN